MLFCFEVHAERADGEPIRDVVWIEARTWLEADRAVKRIAEEKLGAKFIWAESRN